MVELVEHGRADGLGLDSNRRVGDGVGKEDMVDVGVVVQEVVVDREECCS